MKKFSRLFAVLMVLLMVMATVPAAFAAGTEPGKTATVEFALDDVYGFDGEFAFSNSDIITNVKYASNTDCTFEGNKVIYHHGEKAADVTITITCTVKETAKNGDKCDVAFTYEVSDADGNMSAYKTVTKTILVETDEPTPPPTPDDPTPPTPGKVDYTELKEQIEIAEGITNEGYSASSWKAFQDALAAAKEALKSNDQSVVDKAAADLAAAISGLTKLNYQPLIDAIDKTEEFLGKDELGGKLNDLIEALTAARELLNNAEDQASIDAAADALLKALTELETYLQELLANKGVTQIEVEPSGDYCNISIHYVWPILFFISLAVNLVFVAMVIVHFVRRKKNQEDNTPLVNYDIGDDA